MADDGGMLTKSRLSQNPFAIKTITPTRSLADSTEGKDSFCGVSSSSPKIFLRPSLLAAQAEKLKSSAPTQNTTEKTESGKNEVSETTFATDNLLGLPQGGISGNDKESSTCRSEFVFGQNLHERVVVDTKPFPAAAAAASANSSEDGQSELTFEAAASLKEEQEEEGDSFLIEKPCTEQPAKPSKSLSESAEEYQLKQVKRKFDEVTVVTGEEEESNVLQMNCKLFTFDKALGSWQERGRGFLRLNDREVDGTLQSRLVMRTQGSLRVVLNTKVWLGMCVEHSSQKTLRITAIDSEGVRVFLIMANPKDIDQLFGALDWRVAMLKQDERPSEVGNNEPCSNEVPAAATQPEDEDESPQKRWRHSYEDPPESAGSVSSDFSSNSSFHALEES